MRFGTTGFQEYMREHSFHENEPMSTSLMRIGFIGCAERTRDEPRRGNPA